METNAPLPAFRHAIAIHKIFPEISAEELGLERRSPGLACFRAVGPHFLWPNIDPHDAERRATLIDPESIVSHGFPQSPAVWGASFGRLAEDDFEEMISSPAVAG